MDSTCLALTLEGHTTSHNQNDNDNDNDNNNNNNPNPNPNPNQPQYASNLYDEFNSHQAIIL